MSSDFQRRDFLRAIGAGVLGASAGSPASHGEGAAASASVGTIADLPKRRLGRIGIDVPLLSFGTAAMGHAFFLAKPFEEVMFAAIAAGVRYIDTAPIYDVAQERLAPVLAKHRKDVFLVTKSREHTGDGVLRDLKRSLTLMKVDSADLCHIHNLGDFTFEEVTGSRGILEALREAKKRGWIRFVGVSGHIKPDRYVPVIETGEIDMVMCAMNFVDRHTYSFEEKVLPVARRHDCAIVAMKVLGGNSGGFGGYKKRLPGNLITDEHRQWAIDYALSLPGVATMVIGLKSLDELRLVIQAVRRFKPLEGDRREAVLAHGRELANQWGEHFGPAA
jgi:aryl-alcohol dehydrogenase-like predicted oxidoreductase